MAIKIDFKKEYQTAYKTVSGVETGVRHVDMPNATASIIYIDGNKHEVRFTVLIKNENAQEFEHYTIKPDLTAKADNFIKQAYLHIKTLPEFEGSIDV